MAGKWQEYEKQTVEFMKNECWQLIMEYILYSRQEIIINTNFEVNNFNIDLP
jgi:hypothetical protein